MDKKKSTNLRVPVSKARSAIFQYAPNTVRAEIAGIVKSNHHCPKGHPSSKIASCIDDGHMRMCPIHKERHAPGIECVQCGAVRVAKERKAAAARLRQRQAAEEAAKKQKELDNWGKKVPTGGNKKA